MRKLGSIDEARLLADVRTVAGSGQDAAAFQRVFDVYYPRIWGFFAKRAAADLASDLTQEAFVSVLQGKATIPSIAAFEAWLFRIAVNVHRNAVRGEKAEKRSGDEESLDALKGQVKEGLNPWRRSRRTAPCDALTNSIERERLELLKTEIEALPKKMRQCFVYRLFHGLTNREIGKRMRISDQTVKAHIYQARQRISAKLAPDEKTP